MKKIIEKIEEYGLTAEWADGRGGIIDKNNIDPKKVEENKIYERIQLEPAESLEKIFLDLTIRVGDPVVFFEKMQIPEKFLELPTVLLRLLVLDFSLRDGLAIVFFESQQKMFGLLWQDIKRNEEMYSEKYLSYRMAKVFDQESARKDLAKKIFNLFEDLGELCFEEKKGESFLNEMKKVIMEEQEVL